MTGRRRVGGNPGACGRTEQSGEGEKTGDAPDRAAEFATYDRWVRGERAGEGGGGREIITGLARRAPRAATAAANAYSAYRSGGRVRPRSRALACGRGRGPPTAGPKEGSRGEQAEDVSASP